MPHSFRLHPSYTSFSAPCLLQLLKDGMVPCRKAALLPSTMTQQCMCVPVRSRPRSLSQLLRHPSRKLPPLFRPTPPTRTPTPTRPRSTAAVTGHTLLPKVATIQIPTMASPPPPPPPPQPRRQQRPLHTTLTHSTGRVTVNTTAGGMGRLEGLLRSQASRVCRVTLRVTSHLGLRRNSHNLSALWRTRCSPPPSSRTRSRRGTAQRKVVTLRPPCHHTCALPPAGRRRLGRRLLRRRRVRMDTMEAMRHRGEGRVSSASPRRTLLV